MREWPDHWEWDSTGFQSTDKQSGQLHSCTHNTSNIPMSHRMSWWQQAPTSCSRVIRSTNTGLMCFLLVLSCNPQSITAMNQCFPKFKKIVGREKLNDLMIIIKVFIKRKILSSETILSTYMHINTHTGTHTRKHTDYTKLNLHMT